MPSPAPVGAAGALRRGWLWLALLTAVYFGAFVGFPDLFRLLGLNHYNVWFLDTFALLASNDAVSRGWNPYLINPLDYFHRPHVYSHWWLHLRNLGLTRADTRWLGATLAVTFLLAAWWRLRPRTWRELFWYAAVLGSAPVVLAMERGNNDLVIFVLLALLVPCLRSGTRLVRWLAPLLVVLAAMLKYYPVAAALVLLAGADRKEARLRLLVTLLLLASIVFSMVNDLAMVGSSVPQPEGLQNFGAIGFFNGLGWTGWAPKLICVGIGLAALIRCWWSRGLGNWEPSPAQETDWLHFILGAALLTACFFASMNYGYRLIFAVWLAPLLWTLPRDPAAPAQVRRRARQASWLLLVVLWWSPVCCFILNCLTKVVSGPVIERLTKGAFLVEQPVDWAFFLCLMVFLVHFTRRRLEFLRGN